MPCATCIELNGKRSSTAPHQALRLRSAHAATVDRPDDGYVAFYRCTLCRTRMARFCVPGALDGWRFCTSLPDRPGFG